MAYLENVPCVLGRKMYSFIFGWSVLKILMRFISSSVSFKTCVSLLIFCFDDLSSDMSGVLVSYYLWVQFSRSVVSDFLLPMNHSTPGLPVHHKLPEFTQTHAHRVGETIQLSHPLLSPSPPAPNPSQHQGLLQQVNSSHEMAKVLEFQLQHQSFQ